MDYEIQNSVLEKHIENMNNGIDKLKNEIDATNNQNAALESYLISARQEMDLIRKKAKN